MAKPKPTLRRLFFRQHGLAALVTLVLMGLCLLLLADRLSLHSAEQSLVNEIREADLSHMTQGLAQRRGGWLLLDAGGVPLRGRGRMLCGGMGPGWMAQMTGSWSLAPAVMAGRERHGVGQLPWTPEAVVWAARAVPQEGSDPVILVAWNRVGAIRAAAGATYSLVIAAIVLASLISLALTWRTFTGITGVITAVTDSGRRMAAGDFAVHVPEQPARELDELARVVTGLATHLDQSINKLRNEHARLLRLEGAQRQFVADASHELRAPLSAMAITLDAWRDGLLRPDEELDAIAGIRQEVSRLGRMVEQLLDLSRIESGRQPLAILPLQIEPILREVLDTCEHLPGVKIILDTAADLPPVQADADALHRILRNLLDNARRFTPETGSIHVRACGNGQCVRIEVRDTGSGMSDDDLQRAWDRFSRTEQARADGRSGAGLGLAIVRALVDAMDGETGLESREGAGTTVWFTLPAEEI